MVKDHPDNIYYSVLAQRQDAPAVNKTEMIYDFVQSGSLLMNDMLFCCRPIEVLDPLHLQLLRVQASYLVFISLDLWLFQVKVIEI